MKAICLALIAAVVVYANTTTREPSNEELVTELAQCYGDYLGIGEVEIRLSDELRWTTCANGGCGNGPDCQCPAAAWAWPMNEANGSKAVTYYTPVLEDSCFEAGDCATKTTREFLNRNVAHEVCHVANNRSESEANACAARALREAGCF